MTLNEINNTKEKIALLFNAVEKELVDNVDLKHLKWRLKQVAYSKDGTMVAIVTKYYGLHSIEQHIGVSSENVSKSVNLNAT